MRTWWNVLELLFQKFGLSCCYKSLIQAVKDERRSAVGVQQSAIRCGCVVAGVMPVITQATGTDLSDEGTFCLLLLVLEGVKNMYLMFNVSVANPDGKH